MTGMFLTGSQVRAARAMLRLTLRDAAEQSGVGERSLRRIEEVDGVANVTTDMLLSLQRYFEAKGIVFLPSNEHGAGVRLKQPTS